MTVKPLQKTKSDGPELETSLSAADRLLFPNNLRSRSRFFYFGGWRGGKSQLSSERGRREWGEGSYREFWVYFRRGGGKRRRQNGGATGGAAVAGDSDRVQAVGGGQAER
jgi:hypothetical protein